MNSRAHRDLTDYLESERLRARMDNLVRFAVADRIARDIVRRINRPSFLTRLRRHWCIYRRDYLLIGALIVLWALFIHFTPVNS